MTCELSAFRTVPDFAKGHVKDLRVRWALEEAGLDYGEVLIGPAEQESDSYRRWQPFGQVPAFRDETGQLFESGAIVLYIAERSEALAPRDPAGRARVTTWVIAALNSIEPFVGSVVAADLFFGDEPWVDKFRARAVDLMRRRFQSLANWLGDGPYLEDRFTAGDLIMATVLRDAPADELARFANLEAYRDRCIARPAFARALDAQLAAFQRSEAA